MIGLMVNGAQRLTVTGACAGRQPNERGATHRRRSAKHVAYGTVPLARTGPREEDGPVEGRELESVPPAVDDLDRAEMAALLSDLFVDGQVSHEEFYGTLDRIFGAVSRSDLEEAMRGVPSPVQLTPPSLRLTEPLAMHLGGGRARLGAGWQLGATTSVTTGAGATQLDLSAVTWDALVVDLRLETWGSIEVLVPRGVTVQLTGGSGRAQLCHLSPPIPGGPVLRIRVSGPAGAICVRHPEERLGAPYPHRRRNRTAG